MDIHPEKRNIWVEYFDIPAEERNILVDIWIFRLKREIFESNIWIFRLKREIFDLNIWVFRLEREIFELNIWIFRLKREIFELNIWIFGPKRGIFAWIYHCLVWKDDIWVEYLNIGQGLKRGIFERNVIQILQYIIQSLTYWRSIGSKRACIYARWCTRDRTS